MKALIPDEGEWNNYSISNMKGLFEQYDEYIDLGCLGFPDNWEGILRK